MALWVIISFGVLLAAVFVWGIIRHESMVEKEWRAMRFRRRIEIKQTDVNWPSLVEKTLKDNERQKIRNQILNKHLN